MPDAALVQGEDGQTWHLARVVLGGCRQQRAVVGGGGVLVHSFAHAKR